MAKEAAATAPAPKDEEASKAAPKLKLPLGVAMAFLNTLVILGAMGYLYYTRFVYKRPAITETGERDTLEKQRQKRVESIKPGLMNFETTTINIRQAGDPVPVPGKAPLDGVAPGKLHYATVSFSLEVREEELMKDIEPFKAKISDKVISVVGRKTYQELTTVQGRYLLRTQLTDNVNELLAAHQKKAGEDWEPPVINVYFNQFTVQ